MQKTKILKNNERQMSNVQLPMSNFQVVLLQHNDFKIDIFCSFELEIGHWELDIGHSRFCFAENRVKISVDATLKITAVLGASGVVTTWYRFGVDRFWVNWILWFLFLLTIGLGALFLVALEHMVGARWSVPLRRVPERLSSLILLMMPAAMIGLFSLKILYPWTSVENLRNPIIAGKVEWLNEPFFMWRVVSCLILWGLAWIILVHGSLRQDSKRDAKFNLRARRFAPLFMIIFAITITVVAFDWISSLEPEWYSDIFGVYFFAGTFLAGLSAMTIAVVYLKNRGRLSEVGPDHMYNLGGFLFAFTVFWSYIGFAQYMLMWYANMPDEVIWYKERLVGAWGPLLLGLAVVHFLIPFFILIPRGAKSNPKILFWISALMLFSHWLDLYWMIMPTLHRGPLWGLPEISFGALFVSIGLLWMKRMMNRGADMPIGDPLLKEGLEFHL
jgi:hypothetical protein